MAGAAEADSQRCPVCRARLRARDQCARCEADLRLVMASARQAQTERQRALQCLLAEDYVAAAEAIRRAQQLKRDPLDALLAQFIASLV